MYNLKPKMDMLFSVGLASVDLIARLAVVVLHQITRIPVNGDYILLLIEVCHSGAMTTWVWSTNRKAKVAISGLDCLACIILSITLIAYTHNDDFTYWVAIINMPCVAVIWLTAWFASLRLGCGKYEREQHEPDIATTPRFTSKTSPDDLNL